MSKDPIACVYTMFLLSPTSEEFIQPDNNPVYSTAFSTMKLDPKAFLNLLP